MQIVKIADMVAPVEEFSNESSIKYIKMPTFIKKLVSRRKKSVK